MLTDIEIAQQCAMKPITEVAGALGIRPEELEPYGHYKAKLSDDLAKRLENQPDGKLILVTAINPTPAGEGKTVALKGVVVSDIYYAKCNVKYYLDMGGEAAKYSNFSRLYSLVQFFLDLFRYILRLFLFIQDFLHMNILSSSPK